MALQEKILMRKIKKSVARNLELQKKKKDSQKSDEPGSSETTSTISSGQTFQSLSDKISSNTLKALQDMGFTHMTDIQAKTIPSLVNGAHMCACAKTGSGKTLAFLIPAIEMVHFLEFKARNGTCVVILSPTRELCMQTFGMLKALLKYHNYTCALVMGGRKKATEADKLFNGANIVVATPGRLLDHMQNTKGFKFDRCHSLIIDEADEMLSIGFEKEMTQIANLLPGQRQTVLFTATPNAEMQSLHLKLIQLGQWSAKDKNIMVPGRPITIGFEENDNNEKTKVATVEQLDQGYYICPSEERGMYLYSFLWHTRRKKVMVFFSSWLTANHYYKMYSYIGLPVMCIHGKQKQTKRTRTYHQFCQAESGILLCTNVAARGWDIPAVDWILQFDPPEDPKEYIHRVGRTARGEGGQGKALLFLRPEELRFRVYLKLANIPLNLIGFKEGALCDIRKETEDLIGRNYYLKSTAQKAVIGYMKAYNSHKLKDVYNIDTLDIVKVSQSFGLKTPPKLNLDASQKSQNKKRKISYSTNQNKNEHIKKPRKNINKGSQSRQQSFPFSIDL